MSEKIGSDFSVWNVLKKSVEVIKMDLSYYLLMVLAFTILSLLPSYFLFGSVDLTNAEEITQRFSSNFLGMVFLYVLSIILYIVYYIIVIDKTNAILNNYAFENYPYVSRCLSLLLPLLGVYLIYGIAIMVGTFLLIIPGIIIFTIYYLSIPVKVIENIGVFASLSKSKKLTKGHRWSILGIFLVPYILIVGVYMLYTYNIVSNIQETGDISSNFFVGYQVLGALLNASFFTFYIISSIVTYHELVAEKEGIYS